MFLRVVPAGLALFAADAFAQAQPAPAQGSSVVPLILTLLFVLALIPIAVWMMKRLGAGTTATTAGLRVVAQLQLGQRERLVIVEAGERWLVLGVTPSSINRVGTLPKGELPATPAAQAPFAALLHKATQGSKRD